MAARTTRTKIKYQLSNALQKIEGAEAHLVKAAALGKGRSEFLENNLSQFVLSIHLLDKLITEFETRV